MDMRTSAATRTYGTRSGQERSATSLCKNIANRFQEAVNQLAVVVQNLEQIQTESVDVSGASPTKDMTQEQPQDEDQAADAGKQ